MRRKRADARRRPPGESVDQPLARLLHDRPRRASRARRQRANRCPRRAASAGARRPLAAAKKAPRQAPSPERNGAAIPCRMRSRSEPCQACRAAERRRKCFRSSRQPGARTTQCRKPRGLRGPTPSSDAAGDAVRSPSFHGRAQEPGAPRRKRRRARRGARHLRQSARRETLS